MTQTKLEKYRRRLRELTARVQGTAQSLQEQARSTTGGTEGGNLSSAPMHLGDLGTDNIFNGAIARDGRIAISRGTSSSDVVLIRAK